MDVGEKLKNRMVEVMRIIRRSGMGEGRGVEEVYIGEGGEGAGWRGGSL